MIGCVVALSGVSVIFALVPKVVSAGRVALTV